MAKILIWMSPEAGHTIPSIKVAGDLVRRGHAVVYLTCGRICEELASLGFETCRMFHPEWPELPDRSIFTRCASAHSMLVALSRRLKGPRQIRPAFVNEIRDAVLKTGADLLLTDGVYDPLMGVSRELPNCCITARLYVNLPYDFSSLDDPHENTPKLYLSPAQFELPEYVCAGAHYTEPALYLGQYPATSVGDGIIRGMRPVVYCSLGTQLDLYPNALAVYEHVLRAAVAMPAYQFVVNAGSLAARLMETPLSANVLIKQFVPHPDILPRTAIAILQGGFGAIKECIYFGVPMLIVPHAWDQPMNAARIERHRIGLAIPPAQLSPSVVREAIKALASDGSFRSTVSQMQSVFCSSQSGHATAEVCEKLLRV